MSKREREITEIVTREQGKLKNFIRKWVVDESDAEDVLQDVFFELVEAQNLMTPIRQVGAWMYRVARNRMTDLFRKRRAEALRHTPVQASQEEEALSWEDWLPSDEEGPEAAYARGILLEELDAALEALPPEQREVFIAHELEGRSFKELAEATGIPMNTLLSRKHYAVRALRKHLKTIYEEYVHV
ncbi:MAG TPA: sigma-70 family RNA polymerase sigma factor [Geothrix sp.]|nr:sigma-70 family RNA polymerase sigma factor [Geothrix sp.]